MTSRSYKVTSTTSFAPVSGYSATAPYNKVAVQNNSDGDVEIYFGDTATNIIVLQGWGVALDGFQVKGTANVKNITGTGGSVVLTVWAYEGH